MNTRESTIASDRICGAASKQTSELLWFTFLCGIDGTSKQFQQVRNLHRTVTQYNEHYILDKPN